MIVIVLLIILFEIALVALLLISLWKIVAKAGEPGWAGIVPIYNMLVLAKIAGKPMWWGALVLIPIAGIVFQIWIWNRVVKSFGYSEGFTVGVVLLPFIFLPILGFGKAQYSHLPDGVYENGASNPSPSSTPTPEIKTNEDTGSNEGNSSVE
jgi:Family of unknown function (DUF5684)